MTVIYSVRIKSKENKDEFPLVLNFHTASDLQDTLEMINNDKIEVVSAFSVKIMESADEAVQIINSYFA